VRIRKFLDDLREMAQIAQIASVEPEIIVRLKDGAEFTPVKLKGRSGAIIICEDWNG
jgi:hypothetical protein